MTPRGRIVLLLVALTILIAWWTGLFDRAGDVETIRAAVKEAGAWGPIVFVAIAMVSYFFFMLSPPVWAAAVIWPAPLAFLYSLSATLLASFVTYTVARRLDPEWIQERIPASLEVWQERLESHPFSGMLALRLLLWANPLIDLYAAASRFSRPAYVTGTVVGLVVPTAFQIFLGVGGTMLITQLDFPWWYWLAAIVIIGSVALLIRFAYRATFAVDTREAAGPSEGE